MSGTQPPEETAPRQQTFSMRHRARGSHPWARVPTVTLDLAAELALSDAAKLLLLVYVIHRSRERRTAWPGAARIRLLTGWSRSKLQRVRRELEASGAVEVLRRGGGRAATVVRVHPTIEAALLARGVIGEPPGGSSADARGVIGEPPQHEEEQPPAGAAAEPLPAAAEETSGWADPRIGVMFSEIGGAFTRALKGEA